MRLTSRFLLLLVLCAIGLIALVVETLRGGEPSRLFIAALLLWVVLLAYALFVAHRKEASTR